MKRFFLAFAMLALAASLAAAQSPSNAASADAENHAAGSISGSANPGSASPATASRNRTAQDPTAPTSAQPALPPQQQRPEGQSPSLPQGAASLPSTNPADSATLKGQLDQAYQSEPSLSGSNIQVEVTDAAVQLSGSVPTGKEKTTAKRIAQSYAGNRKVVEKLTVTGHGNPSPSPASQPPQKQ
jgi:hypothetical protein